MVPLILVINENPIQGRLLYLFSRKCGARCVVVANCEQAAKAVTSSKFDLVLIDMGVPKDGDGVACVTRLSELMNSRKRRLPMLAVTACAMPGDREKCLSMGMQDYLSMPFTLRQFRTLLSKWLGKDRLLRQAS